MPSTLKQKALQSAPVDERKKKEKPGRYGGLVVVPKTLMKPKPVVIPEPEPRDLLLRHEKPEVKTVN